jgi:hypothetical protein
VQLAFSVGVHTPTQLRVRRLVPVPHVLTLQVL